MSQRFAFLPIASALHDKSLLAAVRGTLVPSLTGLGAVEVDAVATPDLPLVVGVLTGGTEQRILEVWRARTELAAWEPLVILAHGGHNSLPAALEVLARVHQDGGRGRIVYVAGADDVRAWNELARVVDAVRVRRQLGALRIGVVGTPSDWLVASVPDPGVVAERWGPTLVPIEIGRVLERVSRTDAPRDLVHSVITGAARLAEPSTDDVTEAARVSPALASVADEAGVDAVTVRCFDLVTDAHTSGCIALADLNERGTTAGCEGDVVSTIAMAWVRLLLDAVPWMANPARVDVERNQMLLAHCTIARSLVSGYRIRSHFESGLGAAIDGDIDATEVTLVRIGGRALDRIWLAEGRVIASPHQEELCRTQLLVELDRGTVTDVLRSPLGNHVVVVPGRHASTLDDWWQLLVAPSA